MFESKTRKPLSRPQFVRRLLKSVALAGAILAFGVCIGLLGYHFVAGFSWIDALLEASMILTGEGPVRTLPGDAAKIFPSLYALFAGVVFVSVIAVTIAPVLHRILHKFHVDDEDFKKNK